MRTIKILGITSGLLLFLGACGATLDAPSPTVTVITKNSYPELPDIQPLPSLNLRAWKHDVPRDMSKIVPKNTTECINVPEEKRNKAYWNKCGEHPILPDSNIYIGFDQFNWNIILENFAKLREQIFKYEQRIKEINKQRQEWRKKAEEERNKQLEKTN